MLRESKICVKSVENLSRAIRCSPAIHHAHAEYVLRAAPAKAGLVGPVVAIFRADDQAINVFDAFHLEFGSQSYLLEFLGHPRAGAIHVVEDLAAQGDVEPREGLVADDARKTAPGLQGC